MPDADPVRTFVDADGRPRPVPPAAASLGFELHAVTDEGIEASFAPRPEFANIMGYVQGGYLAAMLDAALGCALLATLPVELVAPTLELKVSYLRPVPVDGRVAGRGRVLHRGSTIAFLAAELLDAEGQVAVTASATARIVRLRAQPAERSAGRGVERGVDRGVDRAM